MNTRFIFVLFLASIQVSACSSFSRSNESSNQLTIYSSRQEHLLRPLLDQYTEKTGVDFHLLTAGEAPLIQQLVTEGENTPADLFFTVDAGNLWLASERDLFQKIESKTLEQNIPSHLRDPEGRWFGLSVRARSIFYNPDLISESELSTYEALAQPKFKGKLCLRTSKKVYNQSLVSALILHHGEEKSEEIVKGWVSNLATDVFANDTELLRAISAAQCAVGIANTYYFGRLQRDNADLNVRVFWPNQESFGAHVNISGAGVIKASRNQKEAIQFLEWLSQPEAQKMFASLNLEFPAAGGIPSDPIVSAWGDFKQDLANLMEVGAHQARANRLMERANYR